MNKSLNYIDIYRSMLFYRRFEEACAKAYSSRLIGGFCHLYIGQEAVLAAVMQSIKPNDSMITSYRCHAHMIAIGVEPKFIMAELFGKETGTSKGKGGSMHLFSSEKKFFGGHGIVGAQVPLGTGLAFADRYLNKDNISIVSFGDGALNQGQVYESFNMASLFGLPVVYILENNKYSMGTSNDRAIANCAEINKRAEAFAIKCYEVKNGMDFFELNDVISESFDYCRKNKKPIFININTYRYRGHSMSDPAKYRSKEELENYKKIDPILSMYDYIISNKIANESKIENIEAEISKIVEDAYNFALESSEPSIKELHTDIYCN